MNINKESCVICAWRATCQKKFSVSGKDIRCPEFSRDVSIKEGCAPENKNDGSNSTD
ncbi:MAG: hypothetical protein ISR96_05545 [Nitrospira sp.]|nr:hypothetical protein [bacterium]MBL7048962.1 hypothetical protein [Nitrospira sp.]